ncbi:MAG: hypothetical protein JXQ85_05125 [Cognatishimia sp.]|uniref:hypothetical protein n=1 Tax=Cognatishimia sp. TaxID=2211648 RepID=UPI003B8CF5FD
MSGEYDFLNEIQDKLDEHINEYMMADTPPDRLHWIEVRLAAVARALDTSAIDLKEARLRALGLRK